MHATSIPTASCSAAAEPRRDGGSGCGVTSTAPSEVHVLNDYATPERTFESQRLIVHYVVLGIDAAPVNDDDGDAVPDYEG